MGGWVYLAAECRLRVQSLFVQWAAANCAALPTANADHLVSTPLQFVNRCCSGFPVSGGI